MLSRSIPARRAASVTFPLSSRISAIRYSRDARSRARSTISRYPSWVSLDRVSRGRCACATSSGSASSSMRGPSVTASARSIAFSSSRTACAPGGCTARARAWSPCDRRASRDRASRPSARRRRSRSARTARRPAPRRTARAPARTPARCVVRWFVAPRPVSSRHEATGCGRPGRIAGCNREGHDKTCGKPTCACGMDTIHGTITVQ